MKRSGPIWLGMTSDALSLRVYPEIADFGRMVMRSAFAELRYSTLRLAFTVVAMCLVFLAPPLLAIFARGLPEALGAMSWAIMAFIFAPTLRFYGLPVVQCWRSLLSRRLIRCSPSAPLLILDGPRRPVEGPHSGAVAERPARMTAVGEALSCKTERDENFPVASR